MGVFKIELENEFEADVLSNILEEEGIPCLIVVNESLVYDGLFQASLGWGRIEVPSEHKEMAKVLLQRFKDSTIKE